MSLWENNDGQNSIGSNEKEPTWWPKLCADMAGGAHQFDFWQDVPSNVVELYKFKTEPITPANQEEVVDKLRDFLFKISIGDKDTISNQMLENFTDLKEKLLLPKENNSDMISAIVNYGTTGNGWDTNALNNSNFPYRGMVEDYDTSTVGRLAFRKELVEAANY